MSDECKDNFNLNATRNNAKSKVNSLLRDYIELCEIMRHEFVM